MCFFLLLHGALAVVAQLAARLGPRVFLLMAAAPLATITWAATVAPGVLDGTPIEQRVRWAPALGLDIALRLDAFALVMVTLVSGIGVLIFVYARYYFSERARLGTVAGVLTGFSGAMLGLVLADNVIALFVFWELTSVTSYLLIGIDDGDEHAVDAARQALLTTALGGLTMLAGFVLLAQQAGSYSLAEILAARPGGTVVDIALVLVLVGCFSKSAQAPFHAWLPAAMVAPTPISAYLHSATMVKAGVYLVARMAPAFAGAAPWRPAVLTVGLITMLIGGFSAQRQNDLKLLLAHGTVSQLGLMTVLLGLGYPETTLAGVIVLFAHGAFKAMLFMITGVVDHGAGTRDLRQLRGLYRQLPVTFAVAAVAAASMAGLPPLFGFVAKELAFASYVDRSSAAWARTALPVVVAGSTFTVAYSARYLWGAFARKAPPTDAGRERATAIVHRPAPGFVAPAALLAALTVVLGIVPRLVEPLGVRGAQALSDQVVDAHLALWHGLGAPLVLSLVTITGGLGLWHVGRSAVPAPRRRLLPDASRCYRAAVDGVAAFSDRLTGVVQSGSLPVYLSVILVTALVVPAAPLITRTTWPSGLVLVDHPLQLVVAVLVAAAVVAVLFSRQRLAAVVCLGAVGYGVAALFALHGAPDLALTQLLVETVALVLFVLVLHHLPDRFVHRPWRRDRLPRLVIALAVGALVAGLSVVASGSRVDPPVSEAYVERALTEADGRNVVNVILVDFRAFDTLGETVVLVVAALGLIGLVRAARRERRVRVAPSASSPQPTRPSLVLDTGVRLLLPTIVLFSLFLLVAGHNRPGGGFIGGLVAGAALVLAYIRDPGEDGWARRPVPVSAEALLGAGALLTAATGAASWLSGGAFLESRVLTARLPLLGAVKSSSTLLFDIGLYLVVVGVVVAILDSIGQEGAGQT